MSRPDFKVVYHGNCMDGVVAAAVCCLELCARFNEENPALAIREKEFYKDNAEKFIAASYDVDSFNPADYAADLVYMVDFSFPREQLKQICALSGKVVLIDHHISAARDIGMTKEDGTWTKAPGMPSNLELHLDMTMCGSKLAWHVLAEPRRLEENIVVVPEIIEMTNDYDLWIHKFKSSKYLASAFSSEDWTPGELAETALRFRDGGDNFVSETADRGKVILGAIIHQARLHSKNAVEVEIDGHKGLAIDVPSFMANEMADVLRERDPDFILCYTQRNQKGNPFIKGSFRSRKGKADATELVKKFGNGGGHRDAAGCTMTIDQLKDLLNPPSFGMSLMRRM